ncbi:MAG TPA: MBL fold metallo-hydrolase [Bryobacteraceae bacterium]|nr:MBL fold metallo-hydrolase [Bryobacteraceae bacterium]
MIQWSVTFGTREAGAILRICILASSSAGNSTFLSTGHTRVLIDAGVSGREICEKLAAIGECVEGLDAVLVTHEHADHVCGLMPVLKKARQAAVYTTRLAAPAIDWGKYQPRLVCFQAGERFQVGDFDVQSFTVPHDSVDPVCFRLSACGVCASVVTDLGYMPESVRQHIRDSDWLMLESNHDLDMLKVGPYPWSVKQRVMGRNGHLSNLMVSDYIMDGMNRSLRTLVLAHLSEHNNHPAIAEMTAAQAIARCGAAPALEVTQPRALSAVWEF